ncbi:hypothetical protein [uncultured Microbacterium sp.]|uniref:hypothetical protein n=1 Tax=uncultured Microbacterium sp. TaxID=191216 RepID=UPI0028D8F1D7|nr:hypothetical protein [uncultured Microbacterium sp.]
MDIAKSHLDILYQHKILALVRSLPLTTLVALHDLNLVGRYPDELVLLDQGRAVASGTPDEILQTRPHRSLLQHQRPSRGR